MLWPWETTGVDPDVQDEVGPLVVDVRREAGEPADEMGHERLGRPVDRQRAELGRAPDGAEERLHHPIAGGVHAEAAAEVHADRLRPVSIDDRAEPVTEIVEAGLPRRRSQLPVHSSHRPLDPVRVVVHLRECPSLRAGVAVRQRMLLVAAHAHDPITGDVDDDPADGRADPAEAPYRADLGHLDGRTAHGNPPCQAENRLLRREKEPRGLFRGPRRWRSCHRSIAAPSVTPRCVAEQPPQRRGPASPSRRS